jgi:hypothetical protein
LLFYETRALTFVCFVKFSIKYTRKMKQIFFALKIMCVKARMKKKSRRILFCVTICFILHRNKRNVEEVEIIVRLRELFSSMNALASIKRNAKVCFLHFILNKQDPSIRHFHSACYCIHLRYYQAIGCYRYISKRAKNLCLRANCIHKTSHQICTFADVISREESINLSIIIMKLIKSVVLE